MITLCEMRSYLINCGFPEIKVDIFLTYHRENRHLWQAYKAKAFELINAGAARLSSKGIFEKLREDASLNKIGEFKAPNEFTSLYARIFVFRYPQHKNLFEFKSVGERMAA